MSPPPSPIPRPPRTSGWRSREYLPHWDGGTVAQFITYRLADALPLAVVGELEEELVGVTEAERAMRLRDGFERHLDAGLGVAVLRDSECASLVQEAFLHGDGERYRLLGWTVMPNHVHVVIEPLPTWSLARIVHSWKSFTAHAILKTAAGAAAFPAGGRVWHREYWDRYIRDERHLADTLGYLALNPVRVGLCREAADWQWSQVWRHGHG